MTLLFGEAKNSDSAEKRKCVKGMYLRQGQMSHREIEKKEVVEVMTTQEEVIGD